MPASGIAAISVDVRSQFLSGLIPAQRKTILAAATQRRFLANTVITNQDHPADHFYLLTKGLARFFFVTEEGRKLSLSVAWTRRSVWGSDRVVEPFYLSL